MALDVDPYPNFIRNSLKVEWKYQSLLGPIPEEANVVIEAGCRLAKVLNSGTQIVNHVWCRGQTIPIIIIIII
jgi:hypothetical protein